MPPTTARSKPLTSTRMKAKPESESAILDALADPSTCDAELARRLASALHLDNHVAFLKSTTNGKHKTVQAGDDKEKKRRLAMRAANLASQSLGTVVQSGWKALELKATPAYSLNGVLSIVSSFKSAISLLRELMPATIDVERVASGFTSKLVAVQLYEPALDILDDIKANVIQIYHDSVSVSKSAPKKPTHKSSSPSIVTHLHLVLYPLPAPADSIILGLIGASLGQAMAALAGLMSRVPASDITLEAFATTIDGDGNPLLWHPYLPKEIAGTLMTRAHRTLAIAFSLSNAPPAILLRLRTWALRCLLCNLALESELFWTQAANYMASHGKTASKPEDTPKVIEDILAFFDAVVFAAQERSDAVAFMSGPAFVKCCEVALVYAQRSNEVTSLHRVVRFITTTGSAAGTPCSSDMELDIVKLCATLTQSTALLEHFPNGGIDGNELHSLSECTKVLSGSVTLLSQPDLKSNVGHSLERLRRVCGKVLEEDQCPDELRNAVKDILLNIINMIESALRRLTQCPVKEAANLIARAADSLCTLAKSELVPTNGATHLTAYSYLQRAATLLDHYPASLTGQGNADSFTTLANVVRSLSGAFWRHAVTLYQDGSYAPAVRFLVQACELGVKALEMTADAVLNPENDAWATLRVHLPKRWELLGDCYSKIGDRKLAHNALIQSLKICSFDSLCDSAASSPPDQISSQEHHRRLASVVERITYIAISDLFMKAEGSLRQTLCGVGVKPEAVGLLLEWQVAGLEQSLWKEEIRPVVGHFLGDALDVYGADFPIRRARVLVRQLELAYRTDDMSVPAIAVAEEIQDLLSKPHDTGKDAALAHLQPQYQAAAHMWMVFHSHRRSQNNSHSALILQHATLASKILRSTFPATAVHSVATSPRMSPKAGTTKLARLPTRTSPRKKSRAVKSNPVTPRPRKLALQTPPKANRQTSSKSTPVKVYGVPSDSHLTKTVHMLARLLGLLGHVFLKIQFLNILQRMTESCIGPTADDFVRASVDAASEYSRLGKTQRALAIYKYALAAISSATTAVVSDEVRIHLLLHYAESLALHGDVEKSSSLYEEAHDFSQRLVSQQPRSAAARIRARVALLERSALASNVFSAIQMAQDDPHAAFSTLRQALRLWNRALDTLSRLSPTYFSTSNPFDMSSLARALPSSTEPSQEEKILPQKTYRPNTAMDGLQWRVAEGLLHTLFGLARAYFLQGSIKAAEYFIDQASDLATSLKTPAMMSRALAKKGELMLYQGKPEEAVISLLEAAELLNDLPGIDAADVNRLRAHHSQLMDQHKEAKSLYLKTVSILSELEKALSTVDSSTSGPRKSLTQSPGRSRYPDVLVPGFLAMVLKQQIWLERNEPRVKLKALLDQLVTLPPSRETKAEEVAILAKLALHDAHVQFRADLFLSSLAESTIAVPMGVSSHDMANLSPSGKQMLETLATAKKMFLANLEFVSNRGQASHVREAAVSLALIQAFQTSLGNSDANSARVAAGLLDSSAAITLRRELVDDIEQKFPDLANDDLNWPTYRSRPLKSSRIPQSPQSVDSDPREGRGHTSLDLKAYWRSVRERYYSTYDLDDQSISTSQVNLLPANWTVVSINITEDKSTMFFCRQRPNSEPLIFSVPLERHGRKEEDANEQFTYGDAKEQLNNILQESNLSAKNAKDVPSEDRDAKAAWWAKRASLDKRLRELLENIEFCWLGAFKTILSDPVTMPPDILSGFRARFEKVFKRNLGSDKKQLSRVKFHDALLECFATLSPKCRDEELEDLIYFVLDLYQFHGVHVALSEIDMDQLAVELRTALEEHASKCRGSVLPVEDAHLFLVLDKNVQDIPWESIPVLRGRSVSRIPSLSFLIDRLEFAKLQRESAGLPVRDGLPLDRAVVNPKKTFYVLNPSGDLTRSEARFSDWVKEMEVPAVGWQGIVGQVPSEQELLNAYTNKDLVIYIGHGGAEQYVRSHKIKHLPRCAATMLWGCSSGLMREMGDFDRIGTPYNYMLAGCPTLVACLWDVTDNELDKFSHSVFEKLRLDAEHVKTWDLEAIDDSPVSLVTAVGQSRDVCKLKYLTGAAPVVYGIPFYL